MAKPTPWNSIRESLVDASEQRLTYSDALASPCVSCGTAPCCTHLPLQTFQVTNLVELDHALYVSNFDRIELGLSAKGEWSIYYCYPCRFLDRTSFNCQIHNALEQPQICFHYNPYSCWYKRVLTRSTTEDFIRIDRQRLSFIISHIVFDEERKIVQVPDWETMTQGIVSLPFEPDQAPDASPDLDPVSAVERALDVEHRISDSGDDQVCYTYDLLNKPCDGCQAYCCKALMFPQGLPSTISNLDYYKFCLGFPGIELGIADETWILIVKTTCRDLADNRCSVYGNPDRPILCKYYDEWKCSYKIQFGPSGSRGFCRITLDQFNWLTECFCFDRNGVVTELPSTETIRNHIEERWRESLDQNMMPSLTLPAVDEKTRLATG